MSPKQSALDKIKELESQILAEKINQRNGLLKGKPDEVTKAAGNIVHLEKLISMYQKEAQGKK